MLCQSECACLHKTVNMVVFVKNNKIPIQKGRTLMQMYRVVPITKEETMGLKSWGLGAEAYNISSAFITITSGAFFNLAMNLLQYG